MLQLQTLNYSRNKKGCSSLWPHQTWRYKHSGTAWRMLQILTLSFSVFLVHEHRAGSWLVSNNSSWRRGTGFYSRNKDLVEIFCRGMAFRNERLNCILSVLETQMRYQCWCLTQCLAVSLVGRGAVLSQFIRCWTHFCTVGSQLLMVDFLGSEISQEMNWGVYSSVST